MFRKLGKKKQRFKLWRKKFLSGLQSVGLDIEDVGDFDDGDRDSVILVGGN